MKKIFRYALLCLFLMGCQLSPEKWQDQAKEAGFQKRFYQTDFFTLYGLYRPSIIEGAHQLLVYIEGDGRAWISRTKPSNDPTPENPVGLRLALANTQQDRAILYLARPCQYIKKAKQRHCAVRYWTSARLSKEVIDSLNEAIDAAVKESGAKEVGLIGFSGGGGAAALIAGRRYDVFFLGTVAGNLDIVHWAKLLDISLLSRSLNPIDNAESLRDLPQVHLSSTDDVIMPPEVSKRFCRKVRQPKSCRVIQGVKHTGNWEKYWQKISF